MTPSEERKSVCNHAAIAFIWNELDHFNRDYIAKNQLTYWVGEASICNTLAHVTASLLLLQL